MSRLRPRTLLLPLCAVVALSDCGSEASGPDAAARVTTAVDRSPVSPGQTVTVTVRAEPLGDARVHWIVVTVRGLVEARDSMSYTAPGPQLLSMPLLVPSRPASGSLVITGVASTGSEVVTHQETITVQDIEPPVITFVAVGTAIPGEFLNFHFVAVDTVGIRRAVLTVTGAFQGSDTIEFAVAQPGVRADLNVRVPNDIQLGGDILATLVVTDEAGLSAQVQRSPRIADLRQPVTRLDLGGLRPDQTIGTGETLDLHVTASDNHRLTYLGFGGAGLRDSVPATGGGDSHTFRITIPPSWRLTRPALAAWARDVSGNVSGLAEYSAREIPVYDWVAHSIVSVPFTNDAAPAQVLWDARRNQAYLLRFNSDGDGSGSRIEVIHVPSGTKGTPIALPSVPTAIALTASGDSLVVTLRDLRSLGVVNLLAPVRTTVVVPLVYDTGVDMFPGAALVSGSHVFVPLVHGLYTARLLDVNLRTGAQVIRADLGGSAEISQYPNLFTLPDGRVYLTPASPVARPEDRFFYSPTSDSFTRTQRLRTAGTSQFSSSPSGRVMLGNTVYDAALDSLTTLSTRDWKEEYGLASTISSDGSAVFLSTHYGFEKVRLSDGFLLEQVRLDMTPLLLLALPDGSRLIAVGYLPGSNKSEWVAMLVDLP